MSKFRELLGLPENEDVSLDQVEEAFAKKQFVEKSLLDNKLTELGDKTKELRRVQDEFTLLKETHESYVEANKEPEVDPEKIRLEKRIEALEGEKIRARAEADLLNSGVAPDLVKTLIEHINLNGESSVETIASISNAIQTREGQLKQEFLKSGVRVEAPVGTVKKGASDKTARERYDSINFNNYAEVEKYIREYPEDYAKFRKEK